MTQSDDAGRSGTDRWRGVVVAVAIVAVLIAAYVAVRRSTDDTGSTGDDESVVSVERDSSRSFVGLDPGAFAGRVARPSALVVNVHIPYEGEIEGTDAFIAYDRIVGDSRLPADHDAEIVLYCRSGRMSEIAAAALVRAGYTNVVDLEGGMDAWTATGRPLRGAPATGG